MEPITTAAAAKAGQKLLEELYAAGKGRVASWWHERKNKDIAAKLGKHIRTVGKVKTLLHTDREINLSKIYYPSRVRGQSTKVRSTGRAGAKRILDGRPITITSIADLPYSNYIFEGTVGQGKSFFLRYLCLHQLREANKIPIFLELRNLKPNQDFRDFVYDGFRAHGFTMDAEFFAFYAASERFVLLLDAFDEVPPEAVSSTVYSIQLITERYPSLQILVTSRPDSALHPSPTFQVLKLMPLGTRDHLPFLTKLLEGDDKTAKEIVDATRKSPQIRRLLTTPLLLTLLAVIYNADQSVPENEAEFYQRLFDVLLYRHDRTKAGYRRSRYTTLGEREIQELFEAFCFFTRQAGLGVVTTDQFYAQLKHAKKHTGKSVDDDQFRNELVKVACLLLEEGFSLHFIHKSVQEFYAAAFILHSTEAVAQEFYRVMKDQWRNWRQEIRFLSIIDRYRFSKFFYRPQLLDFAARANPDRPPQGNLKRSAELLKLFEGMTFDLSIVPILTSEEGWRNIVELLYMSYQFAQNENYAYWQANGQIFEAFEKSFMAAGLPTKKRVVQYLEAAHLASEQEEDAEVPLLKVLRECGLMDLAWEMIDQIRADFEKHWKATEELIEMQENRISIFKTG